MWRDARCRVGLVSSLIITLPLPPNMANARYQGHWRSKKRRRLQYLDFADATAAILHTARRPKPIGCEQWRIDAPQITDPARLSFVLYVGNRMDDDNALARCKWPIDWLVANGYLVDDKPAHCRMTIPEQIITRKKTEQRVVIIIAPLSNAPPMVGQDREPA